MARVMAMRHPSYRTATPARDCWSRTRFGRRSCPQVPAQYGDLFYLDDPIGGVCMNVFKAGVILAHRIVAVSHG